MYVFLTYFFCAWFSINSFTRFPRRGITCYIFSLHVAPHSAFYHLINFSKLNRIFLSQQQHSFYTRESIHLCILTVVPENTLSNIWMYGPVFPQIRARTPTSSFSRTSFDSRPPACVLNDSNLLFSFFSHKRTRLVANRWRFLTKETWSRWIQTRASLALKRFKLTS